jgi:prolyl 4-hydroxylase
MTQASGRQRDLQLAAEHDAQGRHDDAVDALAHGASAGDAECMAQLGFRLLTGDRAPSMPVEGSSLLVDAGQRGSAWASNRTAAMLALGVHTPPDWHTALDWLVRAAMQGHSASRQQLLALAGDEALVAQAGRSSTPPWKELAASIDLDAWRRCAPARVLSDEPRVSVFPQMLTASQCTALIGFAAGRMERARVYDPNSQAEVVDAHRSNTLARFGLEAIEFLHVLLQARMAAACGIPPLHFEAPTQLHYAVGEQIADHFDFVDPRMARDYAGEIARNGQRIITFIVYLNDEYAGGETSFRKLGIVHRGSMGEGIYFVNALPDLSPDMRMVHAGEPVASGEKWIVTQFIRSRPTRAAGVSPTGRPSP